MGDVAGLPPCTDGIGPHTFWNDADVKEKIHVDTTITWYMCTINEVIYFFVL